jgi:hypothetical protein
MLAHDAGSGGGGTRPATGAASPGVASAVARIPNYPKDYVITQNLGGLALQQYIYARLMLARLEGADAKKFPTLLNETLEAFDYADKFAAKTVKYADLAAQKGKRKASTPAPWDKTAFAFSLAFLNPFAAMAAYAADNQQDVQAWAENITKMFDAGTAGRQVRDLAAQLNVDAKAAYEQLKLAQDVIKKGADKSAANYDAAMKLAMATKTACKVGLFVTSVIASAGGTAALPSAAFTLGESVGIVINGVDTIIEVGQTASTIILGENHTVTAALGVTSDAIAPISFASGLLTGSLDLKKLAGKTGALSLGDKAGIVGAVEFVAGLDANILNKAYMANKDQLLYVDMNARNQEIKALQLTIPKTADGQPDARALNETLRQEGLPPIPTEQPAAKTIDKFIEEFKDTKPDPAVVLKEIDEAMKEIEALVGVLDKVEDTWKYVGTYHGEGKYTSLYNDGAGGHGEGGLGGLVLELSVSDKNTNTYAARIVHPDSSGRSDFDITFFGQINNGRFQSSRYKDDTNHVTPISTTTCTMSFDLSNNGNKLDGKAYHVFNFTYDNKVHKYTYNYTFKMTRR